MFKSASGVTIGLTTTLPLAPILASGREPCDLNNLFVTHPRRRELLERASRNRMSRTICAWIRGIAAVCLEEGIEETAAAVEGDCAETRLLADLLEEEGVRIVRFGFPPAHLEGERRRIAMREAAAEFCEALGTSLEAAGGVFEDLLPVRRLLWKAQRLYEKCCLHPHDEAPASLRHFLLQVSASDMKGDPAAYEKEVRAYTEELESYLAARGESPSGARRRPLLALLGVPPAFDDLHDAVDRLGGRIVVNETAFWFTLPYCGKPTNGASRNRSPVEDMIAAWSAYPYPLDTATRHSLLFEALDGTPIDGAILYLQSFCHRQLEHPSWRRRLRVPLLVLEGDAPGALDHRSRLRLEAFLEMLGGRSAPAR